MMMKPMTGVVNQVKGILWPEEPKTVGSDLQQEDIQGKEEDQQQRTTPR